MEQWITKADLLQRGWSTHSIDKFLPPPFVAGDSLRRFKSTTQLWPLNLVEQQENSDTFRQDVDKKHLKADRTPFAKQRQHLLSLVERCQITIPRLSYNRIRKATFASRQAFFSFHGMDTSALSHASNAVTLRWQVNYIRHELTCYDDICEQLAWHVGKTQAHRLLKNRVLAVIAQTYPKFREECERQMLECPNLCTNRSDFDTSK
jgi:hypothetical protein